MDPGATIEPDRPDLAEHLAALQAEAAAREAQAYERGYAAGQAAGQATGQQDSNAALSAQWPVLQALLESIQSLRDTPDQLHAPLYRLALRLAQALVRTELSLSSQAIHRLVTLAIDTLDAKASGVLVTLNPEDWDQLRAGIADLDLPWRVETDPGLSRGSVRVSADDAMVEDLLEDRLEALSRELFKPVEAA